MKTILNEGESGAGKTTGLRNMPPDQTIIVTPNAKSLPWPGGTKAFGDRLIRTHLLLGLPQIIGDAVRAGVKYVVIDDLSHFFTARVVSDAFLAQNDKNQAFERYKTMAKNIFDGLFAITNKLTAEGFHDHYLIVLNHVQVDDKGRSVFKSVGKMLEDQIKPVSYFDAVLHSILLHEKPVNERYKYLLNDDGVREAKCPMGVFPESIIPNDMYAFLKAYEKYDAAEQPEPPPQEAPKQQSIQTVS